MEAVRTQSVPPPIIATPRVCIYIYTYIYIYTCICVMGVAGVVCFGGFGLRSLVGSLSVQIGQGRPSPLSNWVQVACPIWSKSLVQCCPSYCSNWVQVTWPIWFTSLAQSGPSHLTDVALLEASLPLLIKCLVMTFLPRRFTSTGPIYVVYTYTYIYIYIYTRAGARRGGPANAAVESERLLSQNGL